MDTLPGETRASGLAVAGLGLMFAGPLAYALLIDNPAMRSSGAVAVGVMAAGGVLTLSALWRDRRTAVRILGAFNLALLAAFVYAFYIGASLPAPSAAVTVETAPDFTVADHTGTPISLREAHARGPVLLVFYRGHW